MTYDPISEIAQEIKRYLEVHPNAADSLDGVVRWWLLQLDRDVATTEVERALERLIGEGAVEKKPVAGSVIYAGTQRA